MYTAGICTLGCKVNYYESNALSGMLKEKGFVIKDFSQNCDLYLINTCTVTSESDRKSRQMIRRAIKRNPQAIIVVMGCYAQTHAEEVLQIPGVSLVCGNRNKKETLDKAIHLLINSPKTSLLNCITSPDSLPFEDMHLSDFDRTRAYIKIEDGCNSHCSYCIIPRARGSVVSRPEKDILQEIQALCRIGCREFVLTGIEIDAYGSDRGGRCLDSLVKKIAEIDGVTRIRLGSLDPSYLKKDVIKNLSGIKKLMPHFHISLQSGSNGVLKRMKRKYNTAMAYESFKLLKEYFPNALFSIDIMTGFPGETEEEFHETKEFLASLDILHMHIFTYSIRENTVAAQMPNQIEESVKIARSNQLAAINDDTFQKILEHSISNQEVFSVLFETEENGMWCGHTPNFIEVHVKSNKNLHNSIENVRLTEPAHGFAIGELI